MPGLRILVVDDEPDLGDVLADLLTAQGHEVQLATDGRGALAVLDLRPIDLVISDVLMPGMDGPALHREIQRRHPALIPRFIWMSGAIARESQAAAYVAATGAPLLTKPFVFPQVLATVAERGRGGRLAPTAGAPAALPAPLRILVVEDDPRLAATVEEILSGEGHLVEVAGDGGAALEVVARVSVLDLIVCDVVMPGLDGPGFFEELERRMPALLSRVVWMSGKTPAEGRQAAFVEASGLPVLWKPFLPHQVIEIVEQRARR